MAVAKNSKATVHPQNVVGRLSLYRRLLSSYVAGDSQHIYSHELASLARVSPAQVRRDLMTISCTGSPSKGYRVDNLIACLSAELDHSTRQNVALVGIGNLGRALITYFHGRREKLAIVAAFDREPDKVNRVVYGCHCHPIEQLEEILTQLEIRAAIITVPAKEAQIVADRLVAAGVRGIVNYAPVPLRVPDYVYLEEQDMTTALERAAYFARKRPSTKR